jgi:hypothetical protein
MTTEPTFDDNKKEGLPPFVSSWRQLYGFVIVNLIVTITVFYTLKKYFE